ncbi:MAG: DNA/RNA non-specific endonuclease [Rikenellaceae bacterium]
MKPRFFILLSSLVLSAFFSFAQQKFPPTSNGELVSHTYYSLSYVERAEQAEWVYYELTPDMVSGAIKRTDDFREDKKVSTSSAQLSDYKGSDYDRGHLCPAGSMSHNKTAMSESFFMSNMSPQVPSFNRGAWKTLETLVRQWVVSDTFLCVASGPVLESGLKSIGANKVAVPNYYYKVIYSPKKAKMIAFLMPNRAIKEPVESFAVSVDKIEQLINVDFFSALDDSLENRLESKFNTGDWTFTVAKTQKTTKSESETASTSCKGKTKAGAPCKNSTTNSNGYCFLHQSQASK